jgi:hypothetical protein
MIGVPEGSTRPDAPEKVLTMSELDHPAPHTRHDLPAQEISAEVLLEKCRSTCG